MITVRMYVAELKREVARRGKCGEYTTEQRERVLQAELIQFTRARTESS
jgi:hypothetical protein